MNEDNFIKNSFLLICSNLATGIFGFIFTIILSKNLGAEGMGLFGLIMPIYNLICCIICGGMVTAISKITAEYYFKRQYYKIKLSINSALKFDLIWSSLCILLFLLLGKFIGLKIIKDSRAIPSLIIICPSMLFIALSSILKGYFYGCSKVQIPAFIDIFEKAFRIFAIFILLEIFKPNKIVDTVTICYGTYALGELMSLLLLGSFYKGTSKFLKELTPKRESRSQLLFNILLISFPLCLNGAITTLFSALSTLIVPRRLMSIGYTHSTALAMIGKFSGMSMNIPYFSIIIVVSICTLLIPDISKNLSLGDSFAAERRTYKIMDLALGLGLATLCICFVIPKELGVLFFHRDDLGSYIKFSSISVPLVFLTVTTYAVLNGLSKQKKLLFNSIISSIIELICLFILSGIPNINIYAYTYTAIITNIIAFSLNYCEIKKSLFLNHSASKLIVEILCGILIYFELSIARNLLITTSTTMLCIIIISLGYCSYYLIKKIAR